jgi:hypothetical protein
MQDGHVQFWPKNFEFVLVQTKQMGAILVGNELLSARICYIQIGQKMVELWARTLAQIWEHVPNFGPVFGP